MKIFKVTAIFLVWVAAVLAIRFINQYYNADRLAISSGDYLQEGQYDRALANADLALETNSLEPNYYRSRALVYLTIQTLEKREEERSEIKKMAYADIVRAEELNPDNLVTLRNMVPLYYFLAVSDPNIPVGEKNQNKEFIEVAVKYFDSLKSRYSHDAGVISLVAEYERKLGLSKEYEKSKEMIRELRPDLIDWYKSFN